MPEHSIGDDADGTCTAGNVDLVAPLGYLIAWALYPYVVVQRLLVAHKLRGPALEVHSRSHTCWSLHHHRCCSTAHPNRNATRRHREFQPDRSSFPFHLEAGQLKPPKLCVDLHARTLDHDGPGNCGVEGNLGRALAPRQYQQASWVADTHQAIYGGPLVKHSRWVSFPYGASQRRCETVDTRSEPKRCDAMPATAAHRPGCRPGQGVQPRSGPLTWTTSSAMLGSSARSQLSCFGTAQSDADWPALGAAARYCRRRSSAQDPGGLHVACHSRTGTPPHISHCARGAR